MMCKNDILFGQTHLGGLWGPLKVTRFGCFYQLVTNSQNASLQGGPGAPLLGSDQKKNHSHI